jgi:uncharacterized protein
MTAQPKPNDPSMEDILASIRRIIADDQAKAVKPAEPAVVAPPTAPAPQPAPIHDDVLELTEALRAPPEPEDDYNQDDVDLLFREIEEEQQAQADEAMIEEVVAVAEAMRAADPAPMFTAAPAPISYAPPTQDFASLISPQAGASVSGAFSQLAHTVLSQNARTLDDLVQEMLKPMLKGWLDENLPTLVERLVRAEIERVARGGR